ncbi:hypothetical protein FQA39_LY19135 [Lamprigera yunnana]|nr:hypothetical protein FQA39_LY19135 [Lamprigera yunnana]
MRDRALRTGLETKSTSGGSPAGRQASAVAEFEAFACGSVTSARRTAGSSPALESIPWILALGPPRPASARPPVRGAQPRSTDGAAPQNAGFGEQGRPKGRARSSAVAESAHTAGVHVEARGPAPGWHWRGDHSCPAGTRECDGELVRFSALGDAAARGEREVEPGADDLRSNPAGHVRIEDRPVWVLSRTALFGAAASFSASLRSAGWSHGAYFHRPPPRQAPKITRVPPQYRSSTRFTRVGPAPSPVAQRSCTCPWRWGRSHRTKQLMPLARARGLPPSALNRPNTGCSPIAP